MADVKTEGQRFGIFGASGCGKTTKAREIIKGLKKIVVFDPLEEWAVNARSWFKKGYKVIKGNTTKAEAFLRLNYERDFILIYVPECGNEENELDRLGKIVLQAQIGFKMKRHSQKLTFVIDELDTGFPSGSNKNKSFIELCRRGRHSGINLIGMSQRINQVNITFRSNLSAIYLFRMAESRDIQSVISFIGNEYAKTFKNLNNYEYIYKSGSLIKVNK